MVYDCPFALGPVQLQKEVAWAARLLSIRVARVCLVRRKGRFVRGIETRSAVVDLKKYEESSDAHTEVLHDHELGRWDRRRREAPKVQCIREPYCVELASSRTLALFRWWSK